MDQETVNLEEPVTLVGSGALDRFMLDQALARAPFLIAADGAADRLAEWGFRPRVVIGDMDSISDPGAWRDRTRLMHLGEQDTTDFEKCLYSVTAPYFIAAGFTGRRIDHTLAVLHVLLRRPDRMVFLIGEVEAMALLPSGREVELDVGVGATVSLFPLRTARGLSSSGLEWPIDGLSLEIGRRIGTSNRASADRVRLVVEGDGVLVMIRRNCLDTLVEGILAARPPAAPR